MIVLLSERFPIVYPVSVATHRAARRVRWLVSRDEGCSRNDAIATPYAVARHSSPIYRRLAGVDMQLQENKRRNLVLAVASLDGRVLAPGQELSFWRCIGKPSARRGFLPGLVIQNGQMRTDVGGGLCQLSNLIYWLVLHSPLQVIEHHHHGYDVFPDSGRVLPFGSGATVFYNYVDLRFSNPTDLSYRLNVWVSEDELQGQLNANRPPQLAYHVQQEGHRFCRADDRWLRENWLYQIAIDRQSGREVGRRLVTHNLSPVMYDVDDATSQDQMVRLARIELAASCSAGKRSIR